MNRRNMLSAFVSFPLFNWTNDKTIPKKDDDHIWAVWKFSKHPKTNEVCLVMTWTCWKKDVADIGCRDFERPLFDSFVSKYPIDKTSLLNDAIKWNVSENKLELIRNAKRFAHTSPENVAYRYYKIII